MTEKREAQFQAEPWDDDEFYVICAGIHASATLRPGEKVKAVMMLERAHRALTGKPALDPYLRIAANAMGSVDLWNEMAPDFAIRPTEALRLISEHMLAGMKSPDAIRSALRRAPYKRERQLAYDNPDNRYGLVRGDPQTSQAYNIVMMMQRVDAMAEIQTEAEAGLEWLKAEEKANAEKRAHERWLKLARGGSKLE